jgi:GTP-binding protein EngB required for normal cell division
MDNNAMWVAQLLRRYSSVLTGMESPPPQLLKSFNTLQLADAVLDSAKLVDAQPDYATQLAVIGPTQSGKSTLVNALLDTDVAGISALAGFTVHAQGYATGCSEAQLTILQQVMAPLVRTAANQLDAHELNSYALESVVAGTQAIEPPTVVWDTPDFDSIDASTYTLAVLNTVALADVIILIVSKDKYGDKSVWDMLSVIEPLNKPLLVCINKLDAFDEDTVATAFLNRFTQHFAQRATPELVLLPFSRKNTTETATPLPDQALLSLFENLNSSQNLIHREDYVSTANQFVENHKAQWFAPLIEEETARQLWQTLIEQTAEKAEAFYVEGYLDNDAKYVTFNRTIAELLTLLEIPGLAPTLAKTRQILTWPARKLIGAGKLAFNRSQFGQTHPILLDEHETDVSNRMLNEALISLQGELLDQPSSAYWNALNSAFRKNEVAIRASFSEESERARDDFAPQIEAAAQQIYVQLQSQPALLNTLRAARASVDAAGIALAIKSGGLAPADLILAPAMLSVTTLLTESALGRYVDSIKSELKERQRAHVTSRVIRGSLCKHLSELTNRLDSRLLYSQHLEPELRDAVNTASHPA